MFTLISPGKMIINYMWHATITYFLIDIFLRTDK